MLLFLTRWGLGLSDRSFDRALIIIPIDIISKKVGHFLCNVLGNFNFFNIIKFYNIFKEFYI